MEENNLSRKVCMITGATSGIGLAAARQLAQLGMELFLVCRNQEKGEQVINMIQNETGNDKLHLITGDLASLQEVRSVAHTFLQYNKPLHILLNNAGVFNTQRKLTKNGYEEMFAVNHLAHFLLTNLLLNCIKASAPARIVNVASGAHMLVKGINFDDLNFDNNFRSLKVYSHSKLANVLFTHELAKRLQDTKVTVNSAYPGEVGTGLGTQNGLFGKVLSAIMKLFLRTPERGAETSIYLCTSKEIESISGKNFRDCKEKLPKPWATDDITAQKLWDVSKKLVGINQ